MSLQLARTLLLSEALDRSALARALRSYVHGEASFVSAIVGVGTDPARVEVASAAWDGPAVVHVVAKEELMAALPDGMASRLFAIPIRRDPQTGAVDVAVVDPEDAHVLNEIGFALQCQVRAVRAPVAAISEVLEGRARRPTQAPTKASQPPAGPGTLSGLGPSKSTPAWGTAAVTDDEPVSQRYEPIPLTVRRTQPGFAPVENPIYALERPRRASDVPVPLVSARPSPPPAALSQAPIPPFADPTPVLLAMRACKTRDDVMRELLVGVRAVAARVGLLVVKRDAFVGWSCSPELCAPETWAAVQISTGYPSVLATASAEGTYLGSVHSSEAHAPLLRAVGRASRDVAITPVKIGARPTLLVYADDLGDPALSTRQMEELARAAGEALARIVRTRDRHV